MDESDQKKPLAKILLTGSGSWLDFETLRSPESSLGSTVTLRELYWHDIALIHDWAHIYHHDVFAPLPRKPIPSHPSAISAVAKTLWTLHSEQTERIWELILDWSVGPDILKEACEEIIEIGCSEQRFTPEDVFRKVEEWLFDESSSRHGAAANVLQIILPAITQESLSELTSNWKPDQLEKSNVGFRQALQQIFYRDPTWTLKTFLQWQRGEHRSKYEYVIIGTLEGVQPHADAGKEYYLSIERLLIQLRITSTNELLRKAVDKLIKFTRDYRSKSTNQAAHQRSGQALSSPRQRKKRGR